MAVTNVRSRQLKDDDVTRADLNTTTTGSAVIRKIIQGTGLSLSSTGVDTGTGDVTITLATSGVTASTYGSSSLIPVITVDTYGRITNVTTAAPAVGITTLNSMTGATQSFAITTTGTDFTINSTSDIHFFNLPSASATARGLVTTLAQTIAGAKTFTSALTVTNGTVNTVLDNATGLGIIGTSSNHPLAIRTNGTNAIYIHASQNISIGTTTENSTYKLDVVGLVRAQSGLAVYNSVSGYGARLSIETVGGAETLKIAKDGSLSGPTNYHFYYNDGTSAFQIKGGTSLITDDSWETMYISGTVSTPSYNGSGTAARKGHFSVGNVWSFGFYDSGASFYSAIASAKTDNNNSALILKYRAAAVNTEGVRLLTTGQLKFAAYTSSTSFTGTAAGYLAFDSSGNIITAGAIGITSIGTTGNGQTGSSQTLATGTSGTDFNISSSSNTHTFNIPDASSTARGLITNTAQSIGGAKTFLNTLIGNDTIRSTNGTVENALSYGTGLGITGTSSNHPLAIRTNNTNAIYIQSNQNVAVGTTTDGGFKLDVNGTTRSVGNLTVGTTTNAGNVFYQQYSFAESWMRMYTFGQSTAEYALTSFIYGSSTTAFENNYSYVGLNNYYNTNAYRGGAISFDMRAGVNPVRIYTKAANANPLEKVSIATNGQVKFHDYTTTTSFTGTVVGILGFDSSGNLLTTTSGGVSDGDKGDITVSGSGATWTIDNTAVTYAKIQNVAANSFLANVTASGATVQEIATNRIPLFSTAITGTPSATTYLRGDGSWATISGSGITTLNTLTAATQTFAVGTSGSDFNISSSGSTHTFNIPDASTLNRGLVTTGTQSFTGAKSFGGAFTANSTVELNGIPVRDVESNVLYYNTTTKRVSYGVVNAAAAGSSGQIQFNNSGVLGAVSTFNYNTANGSLLIGTATATSSAIVEITSTTKGLLLPRMTLTQINAIVSPVPGLMVFRTDGTTTQGPYIYANNGWRSITWR